MEHSCVSLVCALMHVYLLMHHVCIYAMSLHTMCLSSHHACVYHCVHLYAYWRASCIAYMHDVA